MATITGTSGNDDLVGSNLNDAIDGLAGHDVMTGRKGNDTYYVDDGMDTTVEKAGEGLDTIVTSVSHSLWANVEKLVMMAGAGDLWGSGNDSNNILIGNEGNNSLNGNGGADTMAGGKGDDKYYIQNAGDKVVELANEGADTVNSAIDFSLAALANIENLTLTASLGTPALKGTGNALNNVITGNYGDNIIDGRAGADTMKGETGNDTYHIDNVSDVVEEASGEGIDTIISKIALTSAFDNVENYDFSKLLGGTNFTGNDLANTIIGTAGKDTLNGGAGSDTYYVTAQDVVFDSSGQDTVAARFSVNLASYANIENVRLLGTATLNAIGNADTNYLFGNDGANILDGKGGVDIVAGGKGNDTYYVDHSSDFVFEVAGQGIDTVISSVSYDANAASDIERIVLEAGAGDLNVYGTLNKNTLIGNEGNNILDGRFNADTMKGGQGNDEYHVDHIGDKVVERAGEGTDHVFSSVDFSLGGQQIEHLTLLDYVSAVKATGNGLNNEIYGNSNNNVIDGGAGADIMEGGTGNDTYYVDNLGDKVDEAVLSGTDTIVSSIALTNAVSHVENYDFSKVTTAVEFTGTTADNVIKGGLGIDKLTGGKGNDTYYVNNAKDVIVELAVAETDTVSTSAFSIDLSKYANVENATLLGKSALKLTGIAGVANILTGNDGVNVLDGKGGTGLQGDTLIGGRGNDTYIVHDQMDVVMESAGEGIDTVLSTTSYILADNLEKLTLAAGAGNITATGNERSNTIIGNEGDNVIDGGAKADTMKGGKGNDIYIVDNSGDKIVELTGQGRDLVSASVDFSLAALGNVEDLYLTAGAKNATGNALANVIGGNNADNVINGGAGADTMQGGKGWDTYYVDNLSDLVVEQASEGVDMVHSKVALTQGFANVEGYNFSKANKAVNFTGTDDDNHITSSSFADILRGGKGGDTYFINNVGDQVVELSGEGDDFIYSSVSIANLADNVENVAVGYGTEADLNATGNDLGNRVEGGGGDNILNGGKGDDLLWGGYGSDTLIAGEGKDTFMFEGPNSGSSSGHDVITDFDLFNDRLEFVSVSDKDGDGLSELEDFVAGIFDEGAGQDVVLQLVNGGSITFAGIGTGSINSVNDLVADPSTQIIL